MLKEITHFLFHAPRSIALNAKLPHAEFYDTIMLRGDEAGMADWRSSLVEDIKGQVLEIGCGTGLMFSHYNHQVNLMALELKPEFMNLAKSRANTASAKIDLCLGNATMLPFSREAFEYVVCALVLCSVSSVVQVLSEIRRVLNPGGEVRLIEHVRSTKRLSGALMHVFNPLWLMLNNQGCNMNRRTETLLEQNGFILKEVKSFKVFAPGLPAFPMRWIKSVLA